MSNLQHEKEAIEHQIKKLEAELGEIKQEETEARSEIQEGERELQKDLMRKAQISQELQRERAKLIQVERREAAEIGDKHKRMDRAA